MPHWSLKKNHKLSPFFYVTHFLSSSIFTVSSISIFACFLPNSEKHLPPIWDKSDPFYHYHFHRQKRFNLCPFFHLSLHKSCSSPCFLLAVVFCDRSLDFVSGTICWFWIWKGDLFRRSLFGDPMARTRSSSSKWRFCNPSYYLKRPKRLAFLLVTFVCVSLVVWDRQTLLREHEVLFDLWVSLNFLIVALAQILVWLLRVLWDLRGISVKWPSRMSCLIP